MAVVIILPPLLISLNRLAERLIAAVLSIIPIALLLLIMPITVGQWLGVILVVAAIATLLAGAASVFRHSTPIIILMLLWLFWPVWLSERLSGHDLLVNWLAALHPLLAINGQLLDQAIWTERPLMYGWTGLNQDVPFAIPTTVIWCVLLHAALGAVLLIISKWSRNGAIGAVDGRGGGKLTRSCPAIAEGARTIWPNDRVITPI